MKDNQRIRLSKRLLQASLMQLLQSKSIHKISVREICDGAEINRTTFYKYYGSQYDLLKDIEDENLAKIEAYLRALHDANATDPNLTELLEFINENAELFRTLCNNADTEFPQKLFGLPQIRQILTDQLGVQGYLFSFIINGGFSAISDWINQDERESPAEMAAFLNGVFRKLFQLRGWE